MRLGKQRAKRAAKHLERRVTRKNQLVFADLLFLPKNYNCTMYTGILVEIDAHTRYLTAYTVQTKTPQESNRFLRRYVVWLSGKTLDSQYSKFSLMVAASSSMER